MSLLEHRIRAFLLVGALSIFAGAAPVDDARAASAARKVVLDQADFVFSNSMEPPGGDAAWKPVDLPHEWRREQAAGHAVGWYRLRLPSGEKPQGAQGINLNNRRSERLIVFVNGIAVGGSRDVTSSSSRAGDFGTPVYITVPKSHFRAGENTLHVQMVGSDGRLSLDGLGRVVFGDARDVRRETIRAFEIGFEAQRSFYAIALAVGVLTLFLWLARSREAVMLWYSITCLPWAVAGSLRMGLRWVDQPLLNHEVISMYATYGLVVPAMILCLRSINQKFPRLEVVLWVGFVAQILSPLWWPGHGGALFLGLDILNTGLILAGATFVALYAPRPITVGFRVQLAGLALMAVAMSFEVMRFLGWVDVDSPVLRHYHVPAMLVATGVVIFERHVLAIWRSERLAQQLERRVQEKTREIESATEKIRVAQNERTLMAERQRILADMHDGLGASLIGLLRHVQSGHADNLSIELRVREALQEMRVAIDALQPGDGDLSAALASVRYRLTDLLQDAGLKFVWDIEGLPADFKMRSEHVFALQRIVFEAITNALKHSGATEVKVIGHVLDERDIEIRIEDGGKGFDLARVTDGVGLRNMQARAQRLSARLEVRSQPGAGTVVRILLPTGSAIAVGAGEKMPNATTGVAERDVANPGTLPPSEAASGIIPRA